MNPDRHASWRPALIGLCLIGLVFAGIVAGLLLVDAARLAALDPVRMPALAALKERLAENPQDAALQTEIRQLDHALRAAVFDHQAQRNLAAWLLLADALVVLAALALLRRLRPPPETSPDPQAASRPWLPGPALLGLGFSACLVCAALLIIARQATLLIDLPAAKENETQEPTTAMIEAAPSPWPAFRGPGGRAIIEGASPPRRIGEGNRLWRCPLPKPGFSSPVLCGDVIAVLCGDESGVELLGIGADDGQVRWQVALPPRPGDDAPAPQEAGWVASTPVCDDAVIAATCANGSVIGVSREGEQLWLHRPGAPRLNYGYGSSLMLHEGTVFVQRDTDDTAELIAYDLHTGEERWRAIRDGMPSWASPVMTSGAQPLVVCAGEPEVIAYDPATGEERWRAAGIHGELGPSPAAAAGRVLVCQEGSDIVCLDANSGQEHWRHDDLDLPDVSSPLLTPERVYLAQSWGLLQCLDAADGTYRWQSYEVGGMQATPLLVGDAVYLLDDAGVLTVIADSAEGLEVLARSELGEGCVATPMVVGERLYIRSHDALHAFAGELPE